MILTTSASFKLFANIPFLSVAVAFSNVEADNLSWWDLELLVDAGLEVLVQQCLQLFVLLVEKSGLLDQVLSVDKHLVVFGESRVESSPDGPLLV